MASEWFYKVMEAEIGPLSSKEMRALADEGAIRDDTRVRKGRAGKWVRASRVVGLIDREPKKSAPLIQEPPSPIVAIAPHNLVVPPSLEPPITPSPIKRSRFGLLSAAAALLLLVTAGIFVFWHRRPSSTEDIVARCEPSVALIEGKISRGTAFLVRPKTLVTNRHVVVTEFAESLSVYFPSADHQHSGPFNVRVLYFAPHQDLAFLRIESDLPPLPLADSVAYRRGQEVIVVGNPGVGSELILENAVSKGVVSSATTIDGQRLQQLGISINPGNSGGPVLDQHGEVIGVVTSKAAKQEGIAFCIILSDLKAALAELDGMKEKDFQRVRAEHRAFALIARLVVIGQAYERAMLVYSLATLKAHEEGLYYADGITLVRGEVQTMLTDYDDKIIADLEQQIGSVARDPLISANQRQLVRSLWTNWLDIKELVDDPIRAWQGKSWEAYAQRQRALAAERARLMDRVQTL